MKTFAVCFLLFFCFFANFFVQYNLLPYQIKLLTESLIYGLCIYAIGQKKSKGQKIRLHLGMTVLFFLLAAVCSAMVNGYYNIRPIFSLRLVLRFYFLYLAVINLDLTDNELKRINTFLFCIVIIQIPVSFYKYTIQGISETTIGFYAQRGGGITPYIAVVPLGFIAGDYFFNKKKVWHFVFSIGFILYGILGAKRVLFVLYPLSFSGIYLIILFFGKRIHLFNKIFMFFGAILLSIVFSGLTISLIPTLNPEGKVGGSIDFDYLINYAIDYETQKIGVRSGGRFGTLMLVIDHMSEYGFGQIMFGFSPGAYTGSILDDRVYIDERIYAIRGSYGMTGLAYILVEYGIIGAIIIVVFFGKIIAVNWKWCKHEIDGYWKGFTAGSLSFSIFNLFNFLFYSSLAIFDDIVPPIFFYIVGVAFCKYRDLAPTR